MEIRISTFLLLDILFSKYVLAFRISTFFLDNVFSTFCLEFLYQLSCSFCNPLMLMYGSLILNIENYEKIKVVYFLIFESYRKIIFKGKVNLSFLAGLFPAGLFEAGCFFTPRPKMWACLENEGGHPLREKEDKR